MENKDWLEGFFKIISLGTMKIALDIEEYGKVLGGSDSSMELGLGLLCKHYDNFF